MFISLEGDAEYDSVIDIAGIAQFPDVKPH